MTFQQLQYFLEVQKAGTFSQAAKNLFVTTSSVSITIGNLEKELGYPLFIRTPKGLTLTANGKKVLDHASHICEQYRQLGHIQDNSYSALHIAIINYAPAKSAITRLIAANAHRRDTNITISRATSEITQKIALFEIDIGVVQSLHSRNLPLQKTLQSKGLAHKVLDVIPMEIIVGKNHRLFHADTIEPSELENDLFIDYTTRVLSRNDYLKGVITIPQENVVAIHHDDIRYALLSQGVGYSLFRRPPDEICEKYGLRCIPLKDVYAEIVCITNPSRPLNDIGRQFLELLDAEIQNSSHA